MSEHKRNWRINIPGTAPYNARDDPWGQSVYKCPQKKKNQTNITNSSGLDFLFNNMDL